MPSIPYKSLENQLILKAFFFIYPTGIIQYPTGIKKYLRKIFFYLSEIFFYLSEKIIYPTVFLFLSNQFSNFPKTKRCAHKCNDNANQPVKPITITDHENQEQHQEKNQKLKDTESETKSG